MPKPIAHKALPVDSTPSPAPARAVRRLLLPGVASKLSGIGINKIKDFMRQGRVEVVMLDGRARIVEDSLVALIDALPRGHVKGKNPPKSAEAA